MEHYTGCANGDCWLLRNESGITICRTQQCRHGDIYIHNHPTRIPSDTIITQDNVYDQYHLEVNSMNVLMTNYQKDWMIVDIQKQQHLCFLLNETFE